MGEREKEEDWRKVCLVARQKHSHYLETVRPIEHRSILQPDGVMFCIHSPEKWESVPYTMETRAEVMAQMRVQAEESSGCAIAIIVQGVAPEQIGTQIELRPALLTTVIGVGRLAAQQLEIVQRIEFSSKEVVAYGAVFRESVSGVSRAWCPDGLGTETDDQPWPRPTWSLRTGVSDE